VTVSLQVIGAVIVEDGKLLLVSKRAAPHVFYLPGGKPEPGEAPLETLERELREEIGVALVSSEPLATISATAALEGVPMTMAVFATKIEGTVVARAEIASTAWVGLHGHATLNIAPAVRDHVIPALAEAGLLTG
jgi:8-oxo-dGTP diphosphatase